MDEPRSTFGKATGSGVFLALLLALAMGAGVGATYGTGNYWIGRLEVHSRRGHGVVNGLNILIFAGSFLALRRITLVASRFGRCRSLTLARAVGVAAGAGCLYAAWAAHASWSAAEPAILPAAVVDHATRHLQRPGGFFFTFVAAVETGTLLFLTSGPARAYMVATPLCDGCRRWLVVAPSILQFGPSNVHRLLPRLRAGDLSVLKEALPASPHDLVRLDLAACDRCDSDLFLTVLRQKEQVGPDGALHFWQEVHFRNLRVPRSELKHLR